MNKPWDLKCRIDECLVDRRASRTGSSMSLASGSLVIVSCYLMDRLLLADLDIEQIADDTLG